MLADFCAFERQGYWIANQLDQIAAKFDPVDPAAVELHGSPMFDRCRHICVCTVVAKPPRS
ncbi:hypothetical protein [Candidatus Synechococcus calcipolaris]|uniref:hypothetical protein n=1 Tax=Candidatus Synechococcus calcipolaris TaxID=1522304 RepID=UPI003BA8951F